MSIAQEPFSSNIVPHDLHDAHGEGHHGPRAKLIIVGYGFWIFLLSDIVMFSAFFAAHAVLQDSTDGGPKGSELLSICNVAYETACLLLSSFTCGLILVGAEARRMAWTQAALIATGLLGLTFLVLEVREFTEMINQGAGPQRSAFLSSFLRWLGVMERMSALAYSGLAQ